MQPTDQTKDLASPIDFFLKPALFVFCMFSMLALLSMI